MSNDTREGVGTSLDIGTLAIEKVTLKGLGLEGGDALDASHLANVLYKTKKPQTLTEIPDVTGTGHYTPANHDTAVAELNKNQELVLTFAGVGTLTFWGYLKTYDPDEGEIGTVWNVTFSIVVTNLDGTESELGPVWAAAT